MIASIVQYLDRSFFIISYFDFRFTRTYNSILFCCLQRNVEPCCHTHDSLTIMNVYSEARDRSGSVSCFTVMDNCDCVQRFVLGRPTPAVNRKSVAKCKIQTRVQQLLIAKLDIRSESRFLPTQPAFKAPVRGVSVGILPCRLV